MGQEAGAWVGLMGGEKWGKREGKGEMGESFVDDCVLVIWIAVI